MADATCRCTVTVRGGYYLAGHIVGVGNIVWNRRAKCRRKPKKNGYCWQHQDVAKIMARVRGRHQ